MVHHFLLVFHICKYAKYEASTPVVTEKLTEAQKLNIFFF